MVVLFALLLAPAITHAKLVTVAPMKWARGEHSATLLADGRILVAGGLPRNDVLNPHEKPDGDGAIRFRYPQPLDSAELFDPKTNRWTPTGHLIAARFGHAATLLGDGRVLVVGGEGPIGPCVSHPKEDASDDPTMKLHFMNDFLACARGNPLSSAEIWNPATGLWTNAASLLQPHRHPSVLLMADGRVFVSGSAKRFSFGESDPPDELWDHASGQWSAAAARGLRDVADSVPLRLLDGRVLLLGGKTRYSPEHDCETQVWNPSTNTWSIGPSLRARRWMHAAALLADGTVLVAGGRAEEDLIEESETWAPGSPGWQRQGALKRPRRSATLVALRSGGALLAGGVPLSHSEEKDMTESQRRRLPLPPLERWDAASRTWRIAGTLNPIDSGFSMTALPQDRVLITGGFDRRGVASAKARIWSS